MIASMLDLMWSGKACLRAEVLLGCPIAPNESNKQMCPAYCDEEMSKTEAKKADLEGTVKKLTNHIVYWLCSELLFWCLL